MNADTEAEAAVQELFLALLDVPAEEREAWLDAHCQHPAHRAEALRRLELDDKTATRLRPWPPRGEGEAPPGDDTATVAGARSYRLIRELGQGGMGTVWLAERQDGDLRLRVALKRLHPGRASEHVLQRFRAERQILASLDHPGIAKVLDGGTADSGVPFLAMEYIEGQPLDDYCEQHALTARERAVLVLKVAEAVNVAHQRLIVHRDLKPGNILVTADGAPKLLDFGIAKLLDKEAFEFTVAETLAGLSPLTLRFASPEQVRGEPVDTATDIYSLGVVFFKLLTGRLPYESRPSAAALAQSILADEPPPASAFLAGPRRAEVAGDLDAIVAFCLRKNPQERYGSMAALADDLRRYLEGWPVLARQGTTFYRAGKLIRRHRLGLAAVAALFALVAGAALWSRHQAAVLEEERDRVAVAEAKARAQADSARQVSRLLVEIFSGADPIANQGRPPELRELLDRGAARASGELAGQPEVAAALLEAIGTIYDHLGIPDQARPLLEQALALRERDRELEPEAYATARASLAAALRTAGESKAAIDHLRAAVAILGEVLGPRHEKTAYQRILLGNLLMSQEGLTDEAIALIEPAPQVELERRGLASLPATLAGIANSSQLCQAFTARGNLELYRGHAREALGWYQDALRLALLREREEPTRVATLHISVALAQSDLERGEEALAHLGKALALRQAIFGESHPELLSVLANRAVIYFQLGRYAESEADSLAAEAIAARISPDHPVLAMARSNRAEALEKQGRVDEAIELHLATLEQETRQKGPEHEGAVISHMNVCSLLGQRRRFAEALRHGESAVAIADKVLPADHPYRANARITFAQLQVSRGLRSEALGPLRAALEILGDRPDQVSLRAEARFLLAQVLADQPAGRGEALDLARRAAAELNDAKKTDRAREVEAWLAKHA